MLEVYHLAIVKITVLTFLVKRMYMYVAFRGAYFLEIRVKNKSQISSSNLKVIILVARQMFDLCHDFPPSWPIVCGLLLILPPLTKCNLQSCWKKKLHIGNWREGRKKPQDKQQLGISWLILTFKINWPANTATFWSPSTVRSVGDISWELHAQSLGLIIPRDLPTIRIGYVTEIRWPRSLEGRRTGTRERKGTSAEMFVAAVRGRAIKCGNKKKRKKERRNQNRKENIKTIDDY